MGEGTYFTDFFHVSSSEVADEMARLLEKLPETVEQMVPYHFETLFFYHAAIRNRHRINDDPIVRYKAHRGGKVIYSADTCSKCS